MNYETARHKILNEGHEIIRPSWGVCAYIRLAVESDIDYLNYPTQGLIIQSCDKRTCDCKVILYVPTSEDLKADDFAILIRDNNTK